MKTYFVNQAKFTCSKSTIETLEKVGNMFKVKNKNITTSTTSFDHLDHLIIFSNVSIVDFKQVNVS